MAYTKNQWSSGDVISATKMNHLEQGVADSQEKLVSGTNIKTINGTSLLGSGNISTEELFIATYGTTTFVEIRTAVQAGKTVMCRRSASGGRTVVYSLIALEAYKALFGGVYNTDAVTCEVSEANEWSNALQQIGGGAVDSVNGKTGAVVLNSHDVGAATADSVDVLYKLTKGQAWDIVQDNTTAYQKTIPAGAHLSVLNGWGGKSIVWNQLLKVVSATDTNYGLTITTDPEEQNISITGTSTYAGSGTDSNFYTSVFQNFNVIEGHKYFVASTGSIFQVYTYGNLPGQPQQGRYIATATGSGSSSYSIKPTDPSDVLAGSVINETFRCMIVDLTQMFGAGNEPTTVAQFRAMFPADYYPYNAGEMMHGDVTSIVTKRWGGKSIVWNQLVRNGNFTSPFEDDWESNDPSAGRLSVADNTILYTSAKEIYTRINSKLYGAIVEGHKYLLTANIKCSIANTVGLKIVYTGGAEPSVIAVQADTWTEYSAISESTGTHETSRRWIYWNTPLPAGETIEARNFMIFDLTQMFGAGNEPTTVAQFRAMFPADYYPYNTGEELSPVIATHSVPAAVRALTGYGWSAGNVANAVKYNTTTKKWYYHQRVNRVRLADLSCTTWGSTGHSFLLKSNTSLADLKRSTGYNNLSNVIAPEYTAYTHTEVLLGTGSIIQGICSAYDVTGIGIYDNRYSTVENFVQSLGEKFCYYETNEEIVTDVTSLFSGFDNYLSEVEPGGAITFENSHGADYEIPVPSQIDHYRNLSEVTP